MNLDKKILVAGGTGFLGSYLLRYLVSYGFKNIKAIKRKSSRMDLIAEVKDKIEWLEGDILDVPFLEEAMENIDQVYHCAAIVSFQPRDKKRIKEVNEVGTANIVNIALEKDIEKLMHTSSIAALGRAEGTTIINENATWEHNDLNSNYAKSKYNAEMEVWRGMAEGLEVGIVNPSVIMGSGFWEEGTAKMFTTLSKNFPYFAKGGTGMVDVRDVAKAMIQFMNSEIANERIILNDKNLRYKNIFAQVANSTNAKAPPKEISPLLSAIVWRLEWLRSKLTGSSPLYTKENANTTKHFFEYQNNKSKELFNFEYTPIEETLKATGKQFLESKAEGRKFAVLPLN